MILATGARRGLCFVKMFKSLGMKECKESKCIVEMEEMAADVFPDLLDYMHSKQPDNLGRVSSETAVPLRFLANYLGIEPLFNDVITFIQNDLEAETAPTYLAISNVFQDDKVRAASLQLCAENFGGKRIKSNDLSSLSPDIFQEIANHSSCDSRVLSERVADYASNNKTIVDKGFLSHLANATIMPKIDPDSALPLIKLAIDTNVDDGHIHAKSSLIARCIEAVKEEIKISDSDKYKDKMQARSESLDVLDLPTQVKILKEMWQKTVFELREASSELQKVSQELKSFVLVRHGNETLTARKNRNGTYRLDFIGTIYKKG